MAPCVVFRLTDLSYSDLPARRSTATGLLAALLLMGFSTECQAEAPVPALVAGVTDQAPTQSFLCLNMAGIDRGLACLKQCFDAAGQQEFEQLLDYQLHELVDLAGIDRS